MRYTSLPSLFFMIGTDLFLNVDNSTPDEFWYTYTNDIERLVIEQPVAKVLHDMTWYSRNRMI